jgi:hypothetical protein
MRGSLEGLQYGLIASRLALAIMEANSMPRVKQEPAQTNAVDPEAPVPQPESRQVRRARERREAKAAARRGYA